MGQFVNGYVTVITRGYVNSGHHWCSIHGVKSDDRNAGPLVGWEKKSGSQNVAQSKHVNVSIYVGVNTFNIIHVILV